MLAVFYRVECIIDCGPGTLPAEQSGLGVHPLQVLIVESSAELANVWAGHLRRQGAEVAIAHDADDAIARIGAVDFDVLVINLELQSGSSLAVADFAEYHSPGTSVIFVTSTGFFSDGSIFSLVPNVRALVDTDTPPSDLAAMVEHFGAESTAKQDAGASKAG